MRQYHVQCLEPRLIHSEHIKSTELLFCMYINVYVYADSPGSNLRIFNEQSGFLVVIIIF